jgi:hypothetical protein
MAVFIAITCKRPVKRKAVREMAKYRNDGMGVLFKKK